MASALTDGVGGLLQRAGQIFHVFDLSFFASGAATFGAISTALWLGGWRLPLETPTWANVVIFVFGSYVSGVASFAVGRQLRRFSHYRRNLHVTLRALLESHGLLSDTAFAAYFKANDGNDVAYRLYSRLWAELRDSYTSSEGYRMLSRYWVMAAMYDGLVCSFVLWTVLAIAVAMQWIGAATGAQQGVAIAAAAVFAILSFVCNREGLRNFEYQVEDICATFAARRAPLSMPADLA